MSQQLRMGTTSTLVLTGEDGCGKTTAALLLTDHVNSVMNFSVHWTTRHTFQAALDCGTKKARLLILDDFLGHTYLDNFAEWRDIIQFLQTPREERLRKTYILLVTRKSVLEEAQSAFGIDLALFVRNCNTVEFIINRAQKYDSLVKIKVKKPDFKSTASIGFPLCCVLLPRVLLPHICPKNLENFFRCPRAALLETFKNHIDGSHVATMAMALLSLVEGYVNIYSVLENDYSEKLYLNYSEISENEWTERRRSIVDYYEKSEGLVLIQDEFVSFANEAVKEAAVLVLLMKFKERMAPHLSLQLISHLADVTSEERETKLSDEKPVLDKSARNVFLSILKSELRNHRYREVLLQHPAASAQFNEHFTDHVVNVYTCLRDEDGIYSIFWIGAYPTLFKRLTFSFIGNQMNKWTQFQVVLACCFWGYPDILERFLRNAKVLQDNAFPKIDALFPPNAQPEWSKAPFNKTDNLITTAAWRGHTKVVDLLMKMWRYLHFAPGVNYRSMLTHFSFRDEHGMIAKWLNSEIDASGQDTFGMTIVHYAFSREEWFLPDNVVKFGDVQKRNKFGESALLLACKNGWNLSQIQRMDVGNVMVSDSEIATCCLVATIIVDNLDEFNWLKSKLGCDFRHLEMDLLRKSVQRGNRSDIFQQILNGLKEKENLAEISHTFKVACRFSDKSSVDNTSALPNQGQG